MDANTLIKKLTKTGKHAELWPVSSDTKAKGSGNSKNKKKQTNEPKESKTTSDDNEKVLADDSAKDGGSGKESQDGPAPKDPPPNASELDDDDGEIEDVAPDSGGGGGNGGKKKKKKKKKKGQNGNTPNSGEGESLTGGNAPAGTGSPPPTESVDPLMPLMNLSSPHQQQVIYPFPPQNYYPTPVYGMSYSTVYPSTSSSYYPLPVYAYAQSHPPTYPPPPPSDRISAFDDHDDARDYDDDRGCTII